MELKYITCSDSREHVTLDQIMELAGISPRVEIAVQAHPSKMSVGMPRHTWFCELLQNIRSQSLDVNLAVHVNLEWANMISVGKFPPELTEWFYLYNSKNQPIIKRWQINISGSHTPNVDTRAVAKLTQNNPNHDFIIQYTPQQYERVMRLHSLGARMSILYDASSGQGQLATEYNPPLLPNCPQGYSGGISPENVTDVLDKISHVAENHRYTWIDAEGKLKSPDTKKFDIERARSYVNAALNWQKQH